MALAIPTAPIGSNTAAVKTYQSTKCSRQLPSGYRGLYEYTPVPVKQAVISPSALRLMYPAEGMRGYSCGEFLDDLPNEHETEIRRCLRRGAHKVQIDFTEGRPAQKIDPSRVLLHSFVDLNDMGLERFLLPSVNILEYVPVLAPIAIRRTVRT